MRVAKKKAKARETRRTRGEIDEEAMDHLFSLRTDKQALTWALKSATRRTLVAALKFHRDNHERLLVVLENLQPLLKKANDATGDAVLAARRYEE